MFAWVFAEIVTENECGFETLSLNGVHLSANSANI